MVLREVPAENIARPLGRNEVIGLLFRLTIFGAVTYFTIKWMVDAIDPTRKQKVEAQKQVRRVMTAAQLSMWDSVFLKHVCNVRRPPDKSSSTTNYHLIS